MKRGALNRVSVGLALLAGYVSGMLDPNATRNIAYFALGVALAVGVHCYFAWQESRA